jgi:hypothetical protein
MAKNKKKNKKNLVTILSWIYQNPRYACLIVRTVVVTVVNFHARTRGNESILDSKNKKWRNEKRERERAIHRVAEDESKRVFVLVYHRQ